MLRPTGTVRTLSTGRHRLGTPGLVHCLAYPEVERALAERRRRWLAPFRTARHRGAALRRRATLSPAA